MLVALFACAATVAAAAFAATVAAAFGERAAEASADRHTGAIGVAAASDRSVAATADQAAEAITAPSAIVVVVGDDDWEETAVAVRSLLLNALLVGWKVGAEAVVDDLVVLVDAALHLGFLAASEHRECGCGEKWSGDVG
jgi:hypothetical protein